MINVTPILLVPIIALVVLIFVAQPLFKKNIGNESIVTLQESDRELEATLEAWNEIEQDFLMNKVTADDYEQMTQIYKQKAIAQMEQQQQHLVAKANETIRKNIAAEIERALVKEKKEMSV